MPIVSIQDAKLSLEVNAGEILYDSLCDRDFILPHGCLSGSCGACRVEVLDGAANLAEPGVIEVNTVDALKEEFRQTKGEDFLKNKVIRLSCRAKVMGNVTINPIK